MIARKINCLLLQKELELTTSRSSGPGGQNVNKVESKVQIKFNVMDSLILTDLEKEIIKSKYSNKLTKNGELIVTSESKRTQLQNKEVAFKKLDRLLAKAFEKKKKRKPTQPSKAAKLERLKSKKKHSEKKSLRGKVQF